MRRRLLARIVAAAVALVPALAARAQDARLVAITDGDARTAVGALISTAERQGIPRDPLVTKALEGVEKGASGARIEAAVRALTARLITARKALGVAVSSGELLAGADALAAGAQPDELAAIQQDARNRSTSTALGVLAQLAARGVPHKHAAAAVRGLVVRRATPAQFLALQSAVENDLAAGISPLKALDMRYTSLIAALPPPGPPTGSATTTLSPGKP